MRFSYDASDRDRRLVQNCASGADPNARPPASGLYFVDAGLLLDDLAVPLTERFGQRMSVECRSD
jgi:hypothetical protein